MREGSVIADRFELLSVAGSGGSSSVYRAHDLRENQLVAIKVLDRRLPFDLVRFEREATLLSSMRHPNVVEYIAHGEVEGWCYLVQGWVEGTTLAARMAATGVTVKEAVAIAIGVADAAAAAHAHGVIHRDIKPANVLLEGTLEVVKLVDFGIARLASDVGLLTRTGTVIGTPTYMAPEQARGEVMIGSAADVWAMGCVLHEMLTGRAPFSGRTPEAIRAKVLLDHPREIATDCPEAPPELGALVAEMLAKDRMNRPAGGKEVAARLRALPTPGDGPRRRRTRGEPPTALVARSELARGFVMFASVDEGADPRASVTEIAALHGLEVHTFEDATALLAETEQGHGSAAGVARAAIELRHKIPGSAVAVFGQTSIEALEHTLDRGSSLLARAKLSVLFEDEDDAFVRIDGSIASVIEATPVDGLVLATTPEGPILRARK